MQLNSSTGYLEFSDINERKDVQVTVKTLTVDGVDEVSESTVVIINSIIFHILIFLSYAMVLFASFCSSC